MVGISAGFHWALSGLHQVIMTMMVTRVEATEMNMTIYSEYLYLRSMVILRSATQMLHLIGAIVAT